MSHNDERDAAIERLLREALASGAELAPTGDCLDAEQVAAWFDGGLRPAERSRIEGHIADCARCQALMGSVARAGLAQPQAAGGARSRRWLGWLLPVAATAIVVIAVRFMPDEQAEAPVALSDAAPETRPESELARAAEPTAPLPAAPPVGQTMAGRRSADADARGNEQAAKVAPRRLDEIAEVRTERQAAAAEAPKPEGLMAAAQPLVIQSSDPQVQWRVVASSIERTTDGGATWLPSASFNGIAEAGASPAPAVCWLVGRSGFVLVTADGTTWRRVTFAETADLTGVEATDARTATVTTADGRDFQTTDGGATWVRRLLQEN